MENCRTTKEIISGNGLKINIIKRETMTPERKKEIERQIDKMLLFYHGTKCFKDYLLEMAEWADEHPQNDIKKKLDQAYTNGYNDAVEKVCEWLKDNINEYLDWYDWEECCVNKDELLYDFRKAMERETES